MKRVFLFITCFVCYTCSVEVGTTNGVVSGVQLMIGGDKINVFRGVPYANPPTKEQRFQYAVAKDAWTGRYNSTFYRPNCYPGYALANIATSYSEDCLYINIFADNRCLTKLCPVIFYVDSSPYGLREDPEFNESLIVKKFASKNFVVVVPQYRQGIFGNLDLGKSTSSAPYNLELWDLIQALEWTYQEIGSFGGASDRIALMGQGAGADDVIYLASSTRIDPSHFKKIIVISGTAPILYHPSQTISIQVSETVGCHNSSSLSDELLCLQNTPIDTLLSAIPSDFSEKSSFFRPQIDNLIIYSDLWENPAKYLNSKPLLAISNKFEEQIVSNEQEECVENLSLFGYFAKSSLKACQNFFNDSAEIANSAKNAFFVRLAMVNKRETFIGVIADDIFAELDDLENENSSFIKEFFPDVIRRFVMNGQPYTDWPKTDKEGQNFYYIKVDLNSTSKIFPTPIKNQHFDENGVHFWLDTLAEAEKNSTDKIQFQNLREILRKNATEIRRNHCCKKSKFRWLPWTRNRCPCANSTYDDVETTTSSTTRQTTIFDHSSHHNRSFTVFPWKKGHSRRFRSSTKIFRSSTVTYSTTTTTALPETSNSTRFRHSERHSNTQIYPISFLALISSTISPENPKIFGETTARVAEDTTVIPDTAPKYYDSLLWTRYINFLTFFVMIIMAVGIVGLSRLLYYQMAARGGESARKNLGELRQILTTTPPQKGYGLIDE